MERKLSPGVNARCECRCQNRASSWFTLVRQSQGLFAAIFKRNGLICLRPLPSIMAGSLREGGGKQQTLAFCLKRNQWNKLILRRPHWHSNPSFRGAFTHRIREPGLRERAPRDRSLIHTGTHIHTRQDMNSLVAPTTQLQSRSPTSKAKDERRSIYNGHCTGCIPRSRHSLLSVVFTVSWLSPKSQVKKSLTDMVHEGELKSREWIRRRESVLGLWDLFSTHHIMWCRIVQKATHSLTLFKWLGTVISLASPPIHWSRAGVITNENKGNYGGGYHI